MKQRAPSRRALPIAAAAAAVCAGALAASSAALAAGAPPSTTTPAGAPPAPVQARASLYLSKAFSLGHQAVTVPGREVLVTGVVRPYVPGQRVLLVASVGRRRFKTVVLRLKPSRRKVYGGFTWPLRSPRPGPVSVRVVHDSSSGMLAFKARAGYTVLNPVAGPGSTGPFVALIQQRLAALHFFIPLSGVYDLHTELAINAYHRLLRMGEGITTLSPAVVNDLLNGVGTFHIRFPHQGRHAEGNLALQLLALADGPKVYWILPISSGKPSTPTILGSFQIYSRVPGYLPDGMYFSDFFIRGYAIHGYDPAPDYPASHGCMRLPIVDAIPVFDWLAIGDWVDTYYG